MGYTNNPDDENQNEKEINEQGKVITDVRLHAHGRTHALAHIHTHTHGQIGFFLVLYLFFVLNDSVILVSKLWTGLNLSGLFLFCFFFSDEH